MPVTSPWVTVPCPEPKMASLVVAPVSMKVQPACSRCHPTCSIWPRMSDAWPTWVTELFDEPKNDDSPLSWLTVSSIWKNWAPEVKADNARPTGLAA